MQQLSQSPVDEMCVVCLHFGVGGESKCGEMWEKEGDVKAHAV